MRKKKIQYNLWITPADELHKGLKAIRLPKKPVAVVQYDGKRQASAIKFGKVNNLPKRKSNV